MMLSIKYILLGLASIFGAKPQAPEDRETLALEQALESYLKMSDKQRLASDWRGIYYDMNKALNHLKADSHEQK